MPLTYPGEWKFAGPEEIPPIPPAAANSFCNMLTDIASSADDTSIQWDLIEGFKTRFGASAHSTTLDWAESDLRSAMSERAKNSAQFIDNLWRSLEDAGKKGLPIPALRQINDRLLEYNIQFIITPENKLVRSVEVTTPEAPSAPVPFSYMLGEMIGQGGFGVVHHATRATVAGTFEYAIKFLQPSSFSIANEVGRASERFKREVRALQKLQHRAIVTYIDAGIGHDGNPYLVMPYIKGSNIRDATELASPVEVLHLMADVLYGLEHAHEHNVLHRDLKPSNIIVRLSDGQPIILDFGLAFMLDDLDSATLTTTAVGSIGYIPQEVLADHRLKTPLHDIYSSAVLIYELLARRRPNHQDYRPLAEDNPILRPLDDLLIKALGPAHGRPSSARSFREELLKLKLEH